MHSRAKSNVKRKQYWQSLSIGFAILLILIIVSSAPGQEIILNNNFLQGDGITIEPNSLTTTTAYLPEFENNAIDNIGVDGEGDTTSIAIGTDNLSLISYWDGTNGDLKVAHCNDLTCSSVTTATLDSNGDVGQNSDITIGSDGLGLISYYDGTNSALKVAHCNNLMCSSASIVTLDSLGDVGWFTSITIGVDGFWPHQLLRQHKRRPEGSPL